MCTKDHLTWPCLHTFIWHLRRFITDIPVEFWHVWGQFVFFYNDPLLDPFPLHPFRSSLNTQTWQPVVCNPHPPTQQTTSSSQGFKQFWTGEEFAHIFPPLSSNIWSLEYMLHMSNNGNYILPSLHLWAFILLLFKLTILSYDWISMSRQVMLSPFPLCEVLHTARTDPTIWSCSRDGLLYWKFFTCLHMFLLFSQFVHFNLMIEEVCHHEKSVVCKVNVWWSDYGFTELHIAHVFPIGPKYLQDKDMCIECVDNFEKNNLMVVTYKTTSQSSHFHSRMGDCRFPPRLLVSLSFCSVTQFSRLFPGLFLEILT